MNERKKKNEELNRALNNSEDKILHDINTILLLHIYIYIYTYILEPLIISIYFDKTNASILDTIVSKIFIRSAKGMTR